FAWARASCALMAAASGPLPANDAAGSASAARQARRTANLVIGASLRIVTVPLPHSNAVVRRFLAPVPDFAGSGLQRHSPGASTLHHRGDLHDPVPRLQGLVRRRAGD